jgi:hypothetical protein
MVSGKTCELVPNEVIDYPYAGQETATSIFPNFRGAVPLNYGANFSMETMCADTGWLASSADLVKFVSAMFGEAAHAPITAASFSELLHWPDVPEFKSVKSYFAKGWQVTLPSPGHPRRVYREGCLPGSLSVVMHRDDGVTWCFQLNSRPMDFHMCQKEMAELIWRYVDASK